MALGTRKKNSRTRRNIPVDDGDDDANDPAEDERKRRARANNDDNDRPAGVVVDDDDVSDDGEEYVTVTNASDDAVNEDLFPDAGDAKEADDLWTDGIEETERGKPLGDWIGEILEAELTRSQSSGRLMIKYHIEVVTGESTGVKVWKYDGLGSTQQSSITQGQLSRIGINPKNYNMKTLPSALMGLQGVRVAINAKQNGDFYNIFFQRVVTDDVIDVGRSREKSRTQRPSVLEDKPQHKGRRRSL